MADKFNEFLEEVEQDIRQEKYEKIWKKYGKYVLSGVVLSFLAATGYTIYQSRLQERLSQQSYEFSLALNLLAKGDHEAALEGLEKLANQDPSAYTVLTKLTQGIEFSQSINRDDRQKALVIFNKIFDHAAYHEVMRLMALFRYGYLTLEDESDNPKALQNLEAEMERHIAKNSGFSALFDEIKGQIAILNKDYRKAAEIFSILGKDQKLSEPLRMRVQLASQEIASILSQTSLKHPKT